MIRWVPAQSAIIVALHVLNNIQPAFLMVDMHDHMRQELQSRIACVLAVSQRTQAARDLAA